MTVAMAALAGVLLAVTVWTSSLSPPRRESFTGSTMTLQMGFQELLQAPDYATDRITTSIRGVVETLKAGSEAVDYILLSEEDSRKAKMPHDTFVTQMLAADRALTLLRRSNRGTYDRVMGARGGP
jgi:hypothetical protein